MTAGSSLPWGPASLLALLLVPVLVPSGRVSSHGVCRGQQAPVVPTALPVLPRARSLQSGQDLDLQWGVWRSRRGSCRAGPGLCWGRGTPALPQRAQDVPVQGRKGWATPQCLPGWDPNPSHPPTPGPRKGSRALAAPFPHPAGSRGVKALAAPGSLWQEQGVAGAGSWRGQAG